jgi:hypothetical protein
MYSTNVKNTYKYFFLRATSSDKNSSLNNGFSTVHVKDVATLQSLVPTLVVFLALPVAVPLGFCFLTRESHSGAVANVG